MHSLDFSDGSASTTDGRPSAFTLRYAPPEVLDSEPRNRASDVFSLGCVLVEMISGLYGYSLSEVRDHWKKAGNGLISFARNPEATTTWLATLSSTISPRGIPNVRRIQCIVGFIPSTLDEN